MGFAEAAEVFENQCAEEVGGGVGVVSSEGLIDGFESFVVLALKAEGEGVEFEAVGLVGGERHDAGGGLAEGDAILEEGGDVSEFDP